MISEKDIWNALSNVPDPEIPVLNVLDLGVVRSVAVEGQKVSVAVTPTYSGCPATETIAADIRSALIQLGCADPQVKTVLSPAWTTDWISEAGREKLKAFGIAPPVEPSPDAGALFGKPAQVNCPRCASDETELVSQFGSTPCKAMYKCKACLEPFDYFKCLR